MSLRPDRAAAATPILSRRRALATPFALAACETVERVTAVPQALQYSTQVLGILNARLMADTQAAALNEEFAAASRRESQCLGLPPDTDLRRLPPAHLLAPSGGSDHGAIGATSRGTKASCASLSQHSFRLTSSP